MKTKGLLVAIYVFMVIFKLAVHYQNNKYNPLNDTGLFWTESALQYRTAKLVAVHGRITSPDVMLQYPEGMDIQGRLTTLMEVVTGMAYRYLVPNSVPFHVFVLIFIALISSLSLLPLYGTITEICKNTFAGVIGAAFYAVTPAVYTTVIAPGYEYQDFALPLIFLHIYFFVRAMKAQRVSTYAFALLSGTFLFAAFAAWHLTQFYFTLFVVFIALCFFLMRGFNIKPFYIIAGIAALAGSILPAQKNAAFLVSFSMLLSYAVIIGSLMPRRHPVFRKLLTGALILTGVLVTIYIAFVSVFEYRLVYGLMLAKVAHFGIRPSDPHALPWEILVMWVSPFVEPTFKVIVFSIGGLAIAGLIGAIRATRDLLHKGFYAAPGLLLFFTIAFVPLYLLLIRMDAFLVWFLAFHAGMLFSTGKKYVKAAVIVLLCVNIFMLFRMPAKSTGPHQNYLLGMIKYIRQYTPKNAPVLTNFAYGATVAAYTGRPVLLHPKFEAEHIVHKIRSFEHRLYENENALYAFCRSYHARYFVYQTDMLLALGPESMRFRTHNLDLTKDCAAYKLHFQHEELDHFVLVYSNPHYRIFRVVYKQEPITNPPARYLRVYDENMINTAELGIN